MEKNKFIEGLFYELSCQLGKEFEMKQKRVWKNNGVSYEGLVIEKLEGMRKCRKEIGRAHV